MGDGWAGHVIGAGEPPPSRRGRIVLAVGTNRERLGAYTSELIFGVTCEANRAGYEVGLWTAISEDRTSLAPRVRPEEVDGIVASGSLGGDPWVQDLAAAGVPVVIVGRWSGVDGRVQCVDADHEHGAELLLTHLAGLGRRRIAIVTGPLDVSDVILRLHTYERLRVELDLDPDPDLVVTGDFTAASGDAAMEQLLHLERGAPDAVFAMNDAMASGVIRRARSTGLRVPNDIAVVGFDAVIDPMLLPMSITTIRQDVAELGRRGVQALLDLVAGARAGETEVIGVDLLLGESTMGPSPVQPTRRRHLAPVRD